MDTYTDMALGPVSSFSAPAIPGYPAPTFAFNSVANMGNIGRGIGLGSVVRDAGSGNNSIDCYFKYDGDPEPAFYSGKQRGQKGEFGFIVTNENLVVSRGELGPTDGVLLSVGIVNRILRTKKKDQLPTGVDSMDAKSMKEVLSVFKPMGFILHIMGASDDSDYPGVGSARNHYHSKRSGVTQVAGLHNHVPNIWSANSTPVQGDYGCLMLVYTQTDAASIGNLIRDIERVVNTVPGLVDQYPKGNKLKKQLPDFRSDKKSAWQFVPFVARGTKLASIGENLSSISENRPFAFIRCGQFFNTVTRPEHVPVRGIDLAAGLYEDDDYDMNAILGVVPRCEMIVATTFFPEGSFQPEPSTTRRSISQTTREEEEKETETQTTRMERAPQTQTQRPEAPRGAPKPRTTAANVQPSRVAPLANSAVPAAGTNPGQDALTNAAGVNFFG